MDKRDKYLNQLEEKVKAGIDVSKLEDNTEWQAFRDILEKEAASLMDSIASDKFINNHEGYLKTLGALQFIRTLFTTLGLKKMQAKLARERLDTYKKDEKDANPSS